MSEQRSDTVRRIMLVVLGVIGSAGIAGGQVASAERDDPATAFYSWSLLSSAPPEPTVFKVHDLITIIVNENSRQKSEETLETEKDFSIRAELSAFLDVSELLKGTLINGIGGRLDISTRTVETHVANILGKLGTNNRSDAVRLAVEQGYF